MLNLFRKLMFNKYDKFAKELGYPSWKEAEEHTFFIFHIPIDAGWYATELPDKNWAIWNDEGEPPYSFKVIETWEETIRYLKDLFDGSELPEHHWFPEGFDREEDVYKTPPDKEKKL